jgi:LDH2 family malate/lactate/ureidoglycolate dehydrogenase
MVYAFAERLFLKAGVEESSAKLTARGLWFASLRGVDSHGLRLIPHYLKAVQDGRINPHPGFRFERTSASTGRLDADHGFGHAAGIRAMHHAIDLAREAGSGQVVVRNSSHCGAMAYFALEACKQDMIGTAYTHGTPKMRTPNATTKFLGTNPVCVAAPMASEGPFCYDGATTQMSANKIRVYGEHGLELPTLCGADEHGKETRVPGEVVQLLPIGEDTSPSRDRPVCAGSPGRSARRLPLEMTSWVNAAAELPDARAKAPPRRPPIANS